MKKSDRLFRFLIIAVLGLGSAGPVSGFFQPLEREVSPFPEQNVFGLAAPILEPTSSSLMLNAAFAPFFTRNDISVAFAPTAIPDTFYAGASWARDFSDSMAFSGGIKFISVEKLQNISGGVFNNFSRFQNYSLIGALSSKIFSIASLAVEPEVSVLNFFDNAKADFNFSVSTAFELRPQTASFLDAVVVGIAFRNIMGVVVAESKPLALTGNLGARFFKEHLSLGLGFSFVPKTPQPGSGSFSMDLGANLFLFNFLRVGVGLVNLGETTPDLRFSTSLQISRWRFTYGIQNIFQGEATFLNGAKFEQMFALTLEFPLSKEGEKRRKIDKLLGEARKAALEKKFRLAINLYDEILQINSQDPVAGGEVIAVEEALKKEIETTTTAGREAFEKGDRARARKEFEAVLRLDSRNQVALAYLDLIREADKKDKEAKEVKEANELEGNAK